MSSSAMKIFRGSIIDVPKWLESSDSIKLEAYFRLVKRVGLDSFKDADFIGLIEAQDDSHARWVEVRSLIGHRRAELFGRKIMDILNQMIDTRKRMTVAEHDEMFGAGGHVPFDAAFEGPLRESR